MQEVEAAEWIQAPRSRVWARYTDHASWTDWAGIGRARLDRQGAQDRDGVGCVRVIRNLGVAVYEEVTEFDSPRYMAYRVLRGGLPMKNHFGEVVFHERDGGTLVEWRCRFDSRLPGLGKPMGWIVAGVFRRVLKNLKRDVGAQ